MTAAAARVPLARRRLTWVLLVLALLATVVATGWLRSRSVASSPEASTEAGSGESATAAVERRTLIDTEQGSGALKYADTFKVVPAGDGTLTWLPEEGTVLERGDVAYRVDDEPVLLLVGGLPMWRDLDISSTDGPDVKQLERNLAKLGYFAGTVDEDFTGYTQDALEELQEDLGVAETGLAERADFVIASGPVRVGAHTATEGQPLSPGGELYTASSTDQVVSIDLDPDAESLAKVGAAASVTLPSGKQVAATVSSVGALETTQDSQGEDTSTIPVTLTIDKPKRLKGLTVATVNVDLTREAKKNALSVPVTALVALAEGGFGVNKLVDGEPTLVAVETGLYAAGYVEITDGLVEGDQVVIPE